MSQPMGSFTPGAGYCNPSWGNMPTSGNRFDPVTGFNQNESPLIGPMQGGSADSSPSFTPNFGTGSPITDNMTKLLDIGSLQAQTDQFLGPNQTDPSDPLSYSKNVLGPIMGSATQTYKQAMDGSKESKSK